MSELATEEMPQDKNVFHTQGLNAGGNKKYVSKDGHHEAVYDESGNLVTDSLNMMVIGGIREMKK